VYWSDDATQRGEIGSTKIDIQRVNVRESQEGAFEITMNVFGLRPVRTALLSFVRLVSIAGCRGFAGVAVAVPLTIGVRARSGKTRRRHGFPLPSSWCRSSGKR
jgi:hypothetical protein